MRAVDDPVVLSLTALIQTGDVAGLAALLASDPSFATERFGDERASCTALHLATDWPGRYPCAAETIALLVAAGAPVNGRFAGPHTETPLHRAASSDDVAAIAALLAAGADIEATGAALTGGTPLSDAVVFGQWAAARVLVERGAAMTIWQAAAVGHTTELARWLAGSAVTADEVTNACWHACRAGQLDTARMLTERGADVDWLGYDHLTARQAALVAGNADLVLWLATI